MNPQRVLAVVQRQFYLLQASPVRVLPLFTWVAIDILVWGFFTRYLQTVSQVDFVPALLGALLLWNYFGRVMYGVTTAFLEDVWAHNFLNLFSSPLSIGEYQAGLVVTGVGTSLIGLVAMLVLASSVFGLSWFAYGLALIPFLLTLFLFGLALGLAASAMLLWMGPAAEWLVWTAPATLTPFAAVFYPVSVLPGWMQWLAWAMPPAYVFEGMRAVVRQGQVETSVLAGGAALALAYLVAACWLFSFVYGRALHSGRIARYSAEG